MRDKLNISCWGDCTDDSIYTTLVYNNSSIILWLNATVRETQQEICKKEDVLALFILPCFCICFLNVSKWNLIYFLFKFLLRCSGQVGLLICLLALAGLRRYFWQAPIHCCISSSPSFVSDVTYRGSSQWLRLCVTTVNKVIWFSTCAPIAAILWINLTFHNRIFVLWSSGR